MSGQGPQRFVNRHNLGYGRCVQSCTVTAFDRYSANDPEFESNTIAVVRSCLVHEPAKGIDVPFLAVFPPSF
jgi:hypothetical protein